MIEFQYIAGLVFLISVVLYKLTTWYHMFIFCFLSLIGYYTYIEQLSAQFSTNVQYIKGNPKLLHILLKIKNSQSKDLIEKCNYILFLIKKRKNHDYLSISQILDEINVLKSYLQEVHKTKLNKKDKDYIYSHISSLALKLSEMNNVQLSKKNKINNKENYIYSTIMYFTYR